MRTIRLFALALLFSLPASATSYLPVTDEALVDQAPVIAVVEVEGSGPGQEGARPFTRYRVRVERVLKGAMASGLSITVRVPGGTRSDGVKLQIWGAPRFARGERALLFLSPRVDGAYDILHLMLGAFHEVHHLALRNVSEAQAIAHPGEPLAPEVLRDFDRFVRWVAARSRGMRSRADYLVAPTPALRQITEDFTLLGGIRQIWFEFDDGEDVEWHAHQNGQSGLAGGGFAEFQTAIAAWNNLPDSNIAYTYAGTTSATNGFLTYDIVNAILFDDPNNEVSGSVTCTTPGQGSGILAIGGTWYDDSTFPARIANADIVTNNGFACWLQDSNGSKKAEQVFAHELGHTLGIGHSCGSASSGPCNNPIVDQAVMRASAHSDGRGAALNSDDRAAAFFLYGVTALSTELFTITPCRLLDTRNPDGPYGGPALQSGQSRTFAANGQCGIPATAVSLSLNVTVVSPTGNGYVTLFPADQIRPAMGTVSFSGGQTRSNNMLLLLATTEPSFKMFSSVTGNGTVHLVVDVNGYFE